jgi:hypothetical protein
MKECRRGKYVDLLCIFMTSSFNLENQVPRSYLYYDEMKLRVQWRKTCLLNAARNLSQPMSVPLLFCMSRYLFSAV